MALERSEDTFLVELKGSKDTLLVTLEGLRTLFAVVALCDLHIIPVMTKACEQLPVTMGWQMSFS